MEDLAEGLLRGLAGVLRWFLWDIIFHIVLFNLGRLVLLLITPGRYPRGQAIERDVEKISWAGVGVLAAGWVVIALINNYA